MLLPPEPTVKDGAAGRPPGEAAARTAGPGAAPAASTQGSAGARPAGSGGHGMYPPMAGAAGGAQSDGRSRPAFLVDDSDAFVDTRWVCPPVITPNDPL
ncbi:MAG: hypothetical protein L0H64_11945 [Pseudonocardia sp.]|nr:hypothetical protein [Pseudonocardia sp.]